MRVAMVVWEFPPAMASGVATNVDGLAHALARAGHEVVVVTRSIGTGSDDTVTGGEFGAGGVRVLRTAVDLPWIDESSEIARVASANHHLVARVAAFDGWTPEVVHCHDWQSAWAGDVISQVFDVPLIATFHGTERSRHGGHLPPGVASDINSIEWWLAFRATRVITSTRLLEREIADGFELDPARIQRIPNGIDPLWWRPALPIEPIRSEVPVVFTWGRVQYEKGFQVLARAIGTLRTRLPGIECVIAGRGSYLPELQSQIDLEGVADIVSLPGYLSDTELRDALHRATCVVIPSLYEPFAVVALEALASGSALIVADTGGLAEVVGDSGAALLFEPGNADQLADRIERIVTDPVSAAEMRARAAALLDDTYTWDAIATRTLGVYRSVTDR